MKVSYLIATIYYIAVYTSSYFSDINITIIIACIILILLMFIKNHIRFFILTALLITAGMFTQYRDMQPEFITKQILHIQKKYIISADNYYLRVQNKDVLKKLQPFDYIRFYKDDLSKKNVHIFPVKNITQRQLLEKFIKKHSPSRLLLALATGFRRFSYKERTDFMITGTNHIIALSALHIGILFFLLSIVTSKLLPLLRLKPSTTLLGGIGLKLSFVFLFLYITGFPIPAVRASLFMILFDLFLSFGKRVHPFSALLFSMLGTAILVKNSFTSYSFFMTSIAITTIIIVWKKLPSSEIIKTTMLSLIISFFMLPLTIPLTGFIPPMSPLINIIIIPMVTLLVPLCICIQISYLIYPDSSVFFIDAATWLAEIIEQNISFLSSLTASTVIPSPAFSPYLPLFFLFILLLFYIDNRIIKIISLHLFVLVICYVLFYQRDMKPTLKSTWIFPGGSYCYNKENSDGYLVQKKPHYFTDQSQKALEKIPLYIERELMKCNITNLVSAHLHTKLPENIIKKLKKRKRFRYTQFYFFGDNIDTTWKEW